jgi:hypothetical protein
MVRLRTIPQKEFGHLEHQFLSLVETGQDKEKLSAEPCV